MKARVTDFVVAFNERGLLTYASAIAFQVISALAPALLFVLGLLGFLHLQDVYTSDIAPHLRDHLSPAALSIVNDTVGNVLGGAQVFWVTAGALLGRLAGLGRRARGDGRLQHDLRRRGGPTAPAAPEGLDPAGGRDGRVRADGHLGRDPDPRCSTATVARRSTSSSFLSVG